MIFRLNILLAAALGCVAVWSLPIGGAVPAFAQATGAEKPVAPADDDVASRRRYQNCMAQARSNPQAGQSNALDWRLTGGGAAARHCYAVALLGLDLYADAAREFAEIASQDETGTKALRADLYGQSAQAWLLAGRPKVALEAQNRAIDLNPDAIEIRIDRSISLASYGKYWEALDDLNRALDLSPKHVEALVLRGAAYRRVESPELAADDIARALALQPDNPAALLERGILRRMAGDRDAARADWLRVLALQPEGPTADSARREIERIDVKTQ